MAAHTFMTQTLTSTAEPFIWLVTNRAKRRLICRITTAENGTLVLTLVLEDEVILREAHYSGAQALERATSLRLLLANWEHTC